jgi:hypothetical protein
MDYTLSNSFATDVGTGNRMHLQAQAVPTAVSDQDMNQVIWELMEIVKAAGLAGAQFDKAVPGSYTKLLSALRAAGVLQTAPQFDNTTKAATTEFVRQVGVQFNGEAVLATSQTLTGAHAGKVIVGNSPTPITLTLPASNSFGFGAGFTFLNVNAGVVTVLRGGADVIIGGAASQNSFLLGAGDTLQLESLGGGGWRAIGGSAQLGLSAQFGVLAANSGYQRLPSGIIVQWGQSTFNFGGVGTLVNTITFPVSFVNVPYSVTTCAQTNAPSSFFSSAAGLAVSGFNLHAYASGASAGQVFFWMAVGK